MRYLDFICTGEMFNGACDPSVREFDAWEDYDILTEFYDSCPECRSFPKEEYFKNSPDPARWTDYVIWEDGRIAARAAVWRASDESWEVAGVIVRPEYRGRGYSARIVRHCVSKILEQGRSAILSTAETNLPMIAAAEKAGFQRLESE